MPRPKLPDDEKLHPISVYLTGAEIAQLEAEAAAAGRTGASAHIRWILAQRRKK